jgi:hypothetical protein
MAVGAVLLKLLGGDSIFVGGADQKRAKITGIV